MTWIHRLTTGSFAAAIFVSGCGALDHSRSSDPFLKGPSEPARQESKVARAQQPSGSPTRQVATRQPSVRPGAAPRQNNGIQTVGYEESDPSTRSTDAAIIRTAAEERIPLACPPEDPEYGCQPCLPCLADPGGMASDEYLCDGGDREYPVHYEAHGMAGLDSEDAIAEFHDSNNRRRVQPTNRVCVYSPRFAAVTSITEPNENVTSDYLVSGRNTAVIDLVRERKAVIHQRQSEGTDRLVARKRGSELYLPVQRDELHGRERIEIHDQAIFVHTNYAFVRAGILLKEEEAVLAKSIQTAVTLTRVENPVIQAHAAGLGEVRSVFKDNEITGVDVPGKPGRLRIVKLADRQDAVPGDVITFTIRFDNLGDLPLTEVSIIDNLTPRLEYVPDSASLDRKGALQVTDNGEGSLILTWKLEEPLPGRQGGIVSFQAKVR